MSSRKAVASCWDLIQTVLPHSARMLLHSDAPSPGKSTLALTYGLRKGQTVHSVSCHQGATVSDWLGGWRLTDGNTVWIDGPVAKAWKTGGRLVIDEINFAADEILSILYKVLDDERIAQIELGNGEVIRPAQGFQCLATMNGRPEDLPDALQSRFPVTVEIDTVHPDALAALPEDLQTIAANTAMNPDVDRRIPLRVWNEFARIRAIDGAEVAARVTMRHRAQEVLDGLAVTRDR